MTRKGPSNEGSFLLIKLNLRLQSAVFIKNTADMFIFYKGIFADKFFVGFYGHFVAYAKTFKVVGLVNFVRQGFEGVIQISKIMNMVVVVYV